MVEEGDRLINGEAIENLPGIELFISRNTPITPVETSIERKHAMMNMTFDRSNAQGAPALSLVNRLPEIKREILSDPIRMRQFVGLAERFINPNPHED